jgi:DNA-binding transcriptional LysR family regulator
VSDLVAKQLLDSKRLFFFYHVAREQSFSRAADAVRAPQPVISRHVHKLEDEIGVQLLERHGRGVRMTRFGEILFRRAEAILGEMEEALTEIDSAQRQPTGRVRIAATATVMSLYMPEVVSRFTHNYPEVEFTATQASTGEVYNLLVTGKVDVGIVLEEPNKAKFEVEPLLDEPMMLVVAKSNSLSERRVISRRMLANANLLLPASAHGLRQIIDDYAAEGGITLQPHLQIDSLPLIRAVIQRGEHATILPLSTCNLEFDRKDTAVLPIQPTFSRTLSAAYLREGQRSAYIDQLMRHVREVFRETSQGAEAAA